MKIISELGILGFKSAADGVDKFGKSYGGRI
jgi:hypothetical protein